MSIVYYSTWSRSHIDETGDGSTSESLTHITQCDLQKFLPKFFPKNLSSKNHLFLE